MTVSRTQSTTESHRAVAIVRNDAEAVGLAADLAAEFAVDAAERELSRILPAVEMDVLSASGLLAVTVPREYGGADVSASSVAEVFRILAMADPNIAEIMHSHFAYVNLLRLAANVRQRELLFAEILAGSRIASAQSERTNPAVSEIATTLWPVGSAGFILSGTKCLCSGAVFADRIAVLARLDDPNQVAGLAEGEHVAYLPASTPGLSVDDDWDTLGQRLTASGTVRLDHVQVPAESVVPRRAAFQQPYSCAAYSQLLHAAIDTGIARSALAEAARFVNAQRRDSARTDDDPLLTQRFGELEVDVSAAESMLHTAAERVDLALDKPWEQTASDASIAVATAKILGERTALDAGSALFEVAGERSASAELNLSRHWRNVRTHTLHDPIRWKYHHIGRHTLSGIAPPRQGVI
ncbi:MAG: SfnB family sulfur acquisition oxidoreductase [Nocardioidaceae bacterium]